MDEKEKKDNDNKWTCGRCGHTNNEYRPISEKEIVFCDNCLKSYKIKNGTLIYE